MQTLAFEDAAYPGAAAGSAVGCGLVQPKNGPCGLIAAIQAACIAEMIRTGGDDAPARPREQRLRQRREAAARRAAPLREAVREAARRARERVAAEPERL